MKILFLIRDKFGDSVIAACAALDYARTHQHDACSVLIRSEYAPILQYEDKLNVYRYVSRPLAFLLAYWWRISHKSFDVLCVLRGFGGQSARLSNAIPAKRKVVPEHLPINFSAVVVEKTDKHFIYQPLLKYSIDLIHGFSRDAINPHQLILPGLCEKWKGHQKKYVAVFPMASELRREIPNDALIKLVKELIVTFPDHQVIILCRNTVEMKKLLFSDSLAPIVKYGDITGLMKYLLQSVAYYGVDSGHYHLAASMGMPCTVFFGPSEPSFVVLTNQTNAKAVRLPFLGERFCPEKSCTRPYCLDYAVSSFVSQPIVEVEQNGYLPQCLLRHKHE